MLETIAGFALLVTQCAVAQSEAAPQWDGGGIIEPGEDEVAELARAAQNPIASMISVPFQNNTNLDFGPLEKTQNVLNIQPVYPIDLSENWNLVTRAIFPVVTQPGFVPGQSSTTGLGDTVITAANTSILVSDPGSFTDRMLSEGAVPFTVTLVGNENPDNKTIVARRKVAGAIEFADHDQVDAEWPTGVISLSHVALPFPPDDPVYGESRPDDSGLVFLGRMTLQGERGLLKIPDDWMLHIRYNPICEYLETRTLEWLGANLQIELNQHSVTRPKIKQNRGEAKCQFFAARRSRARFSFF